MEDENIDEWELMYGNDMEAANELVVTQQEIASMPAPAVSHPSPQSSDPLQVQNSEINDYDMDTSEPPPNQQEEEEYILRRPSLVNPTIACVLASGERVFIKKKDEEPRFMRSKATNQNVQWKLASSVKTLLEEIHNRAVEAVVEEDRQKEEAEYVADVVNPVTENNLWLDKYRPRHFVDLLSDERTNREVLLWLKSWDATVFPQKVKTNTPKSKLPEQNKAGDMRPEQKIILICGPPGAGKTTLAGIAARHAGYNPIEINASDDRTAGVLKEKIISAMEMQSIFGDQRPNCIILDEIDGALSGQEGKGAISALQALVTAPYAPRSKKGKKAANAGGHPLIRPIICICNDQFAPVLRPLRKLAKIFIMHTPEPRQLMQRLKYICKQEKVQASNSLLSTLCLRADNDVRFCLNALQFASAKTSTLTLSMIDNMMGRKDVSKGAYDVWETVFYESKEQQKNDSDSFSRVFEATDRFGSQDLILSGLHENLLPLAFNDPTLSKIHNALEWMGFADLCETRVRAHQQFALTPYTSVAAVSVYRACCTSSRRRIEYPKASYDCRKKIESSQSIIEALVEPGVNLRLGSRVLTLDVIPWIVSMLNPAINSAPNHNSKEPMDRLVALMSSLHVSYKQVQMPGGVVEYSLEPSLDMLVKYYGLEPRMRLPLGIRQTMAREVELENLRRADKGNKIPVEAPAEVSTYDMSNPFGLKKRKREDQTTSNAKRWPIRFKFNEGYTCGIKRPVLVQDLL